jgi:signal transduction histidine kinase
MAIAQSTRPDRSRTPATVSPAGASDTKAILPRTRSRLLSLLLGPAFPPLALGIAVAASFIVAETTLVYLLKQVAPTERLGAIYLVGVLVISTVWRLALAVATSIASAIAFDVVRGWPTGHFLPTEAQQAVVHGSLLIVALTANALASLARARAEEADRRRREADLAADLAHLMLRTGDLDSALVIAAQHLAQALELPFAALARGAFRPDDRHAAILLRDGPAVLGALLVPFELPRQTMQRLRERVVPSLEALLRAACEREAISKALQASCQELAELADQQAALRRIATLVARGVTPSRVFSAVVEEIARCLHVRDAVLLRYQPDGEAVLAAHGGVGATTIAVGGVKAPIVLDGRVWGAVVVDSSRPELLPADTRGRVKDFADLVATAIANAAAREELTASRARIVAAADTARRQLERDLHDGAQQRLETLKLEVRLAEESVPPKLDDLREQISNIVVGLEGVSEDLHEFSRGIHPAVLAGGLSAALRTLANRSAVPVTLDVAVEDTQMSDSVEVAAYYVVAESLTNTAKYARASEVHVSGHVEGQSLCLCVRDNGIGGVDPGKGSGLIGLTDRVEALGGRMQIASPPGAGTALHVRLPVKAR